jgi:hypothetical protein
VIAVIVLTRQQQSKVSVVELVWGQGCCSACGPCWRNVSTWCKCASWAGDEWHHCKSHGMDCVWIALNWIVYQTVVCNRYIYLNILLIFSTHYFLVVFILLPTFSVASQGTACVRDPSLCCWNNHFWLQNNHRAPCAPASDC